MRLVSSDSMKSDVSVDSRRSQSLAASCFFFCVCFDNLFRSIAVNVRAACFERDFFDRVLQRKSIEIRT
jgi:hypothetical protein